MTEEEKISHNGHRVRLKKLLEKGGFDSFTENQILEFILFFAIPYHDTKPIADALLEKFCKLYYVLSAPFSSLMEIKGMTENAALLCGTLLDIYSRSQRKKAETITIRDSSEVVPFLRSLISLNRVEAFAICLDSTFRVICVEKIENYCGQEVIIETKELVEISIRNNAKKMILACNRNYDSFTPTKDDIYNTIRLQNYLATIKIELVDHIVISKKSVYSMHKGCNI